jgi:hypothetical protein
MMTGTGDLRSDIRSNEELNVIVLQLKALEVAGFDPLMKLSQWLNIVLEACDSESYLCGRKAKDLWIWLGIIRTSLVGHEMQWAQATNHLRRPLRRRPPS